jgi:transcriptional regulator with XRE-family HTH domain
MKLGERLFEYRKKKGLSQEEVASKLNVTRQTISKWETDQSLPDFDKIVPICELFGITTAELLKGEKEESIIINSDLKYKKEKALIMSISIFLYFLSIIWIILASELFNINDGLIVSIFMFICAVATIIMIYYFIANDHSRKEIKKKENKKLKDILYITSILFLIIYLTVSFITFAWHITWMIWLIYSLVVSIIKLIFKDGDNNE